MFGLKFSGKGWVQPRLLQCLQRGGYSLVEAVEALGLFRERFRCFNGCFLRWRGEEGYKQPRGRIEKFLGQRRSRVLPEGRDVGWNSGCPQIGGGRLRTGPFSPSEEGGSGARGGGRIQRGGFALVR